MAARRSGGPATVYIQHDRIVKRWKTTGLCETEAGEGGLPDGSPAQPESLGEEFAAVAEPLLVDAVADPGRHVPLGGNLQRRQILRALEQRLGRDQLVLVAMHQQHRRAALD